MRGPQTSEALIFHQGHHLEAANDVTDTEGREEEHFIMSMETDMSESGTETSRMERGHTTTQTETGERGVEV